MSILSSIIIATLLISSISLSAIFFLFFKKDILNRMTLLLVALSAGSFIGGAFLHLLPEAANKMDAEKMFTLVMFSFIIFFLMEKVLHWRHCHKDNCKVHAFAYVNLIGDTVHNFIDGLIIGGSFLLDFQLGVASTLMIALHEIPQEIGDFAVMLHAGLERKKALFLNFLVALSVIFGGVFAYFASSHLENLMAYLLPFAAGGFLYIAASDLIPEIKKHATMKELINSFLMFLLGILLMYLVKFFEV